MVTLGQFLIQKLQEYGVNEVFGIPGDFVLPLFRCIEEEGGLRLVSFSHEPSVGFAADGAARCSGRLGVACVTYGAGALNMVNPVAGAYAEKSPVVVISGGPGRVRDLWKIVTYKPFFYLPRTSGCLHEPFPSPLPKGASQLTSHPANVVETAP